MRAKRREAGGASAAAIGLGLLAFILILALATPARAASFKDVGDAEWFSEAVQVLSDKGIIQGKADGTFRPYDPITRAELTVIISRCLELAPGLSHPFTDLPSGAWFEPAVAALFKTGIVQGVSPTKFDPSGRVSRQQAASFVMRTLMYRLDEQSAGASDAALSPSDSGPWLQGFPDRGFIAAAHQNAVANAYRLRVVSGQSDGRFYPLAQVTRAQSAGMLYTALFASPAPLTNPPAPRSTNPAYPDARVGVRGPQVAWLEQRLTDLTYRPGAIDGVFDERTRHAVIAFQKWEGLSRDGVVGAKTWVRLATATQPTPARSRSGVWIEVNKTKQVFLYIVNGTVKRTLPTSTGKAFTYRSAPYTVQRKPIADGPRYRALYLNPGNVLAIHGYPSVPTYPASGGCIRLTKWDMDDLRARDRFDPMIPNGTLVYIY
ncbi:MAG: S-layer homology domain-containing protein [Thermoleophilia bacterium]